MNRDTPPLVSVGLPTFNRAHLLPAALDSLLNQSYRNIEYIVSDNASTDRTEEIVRSYARRDPRIRSIRQKTNINGMNNHEFVLNEARGEYFMWASDDDWWDRRFVEKLISALETHPDYGAAMSHYNQRFIHGGATTTKLVTHHFTNLTHQALYRIYLRGRATPIFFFAIYRTPLLKRIFRRKSPSCFNGLMLTLSEVALATRCFSVPEMLHEQLQDTRLHIVRHPDNPYTVGELDQFAVTRYALKIPWWLLTSPAIPLTRKRLIFTPWLWRTWLYKRKIARELWRYLKHLVMPIDQNPEALKVLLDRWLTTRNYVELADAYFFLGRIAGKDRSALQRAIRQRKEIIGRDLDSAKKLEFLEFHLCPSP